MLQAWIACLLCVGVAAAASPTGAAELQIANTSGKAIYELYLAAKGERTWGVDRLREKQPRMIARGETHTVADIAPGSYQLMLVDADGSECKIDALDLTSSHRIDLTSARLRECRSSH
jgi:hypothetical protein